MQIFPRINSYLTFATCPLSDGGHRLPKSPGLLKDPEPEIRVSGAITFPLEPTFTLTVALKVKGVGVERFLRRSYGFGLKRSRIHSGKCQWQTWEGNRLVTGRSAQTTR